MKLTKFHLNMTVLNLTDGQKGAKNPLVSAYVTYVGICTYPPAFRNQKSQSCKIRNLSSIYTRRSTVSFWLKSKHRKWTFT